VRLVRVAEGLGPTAGGDGPIFRPAGGVVRRSGVLGRHRGPPRASRAPPPTGGRRGNGRPGPAGRRVPRNARNTGSAVRGSLSWSRRNRSARVGIGSTLFKVNGPALGGFRTKVMSANVTR